MTIHDIKSISNLEFTFPLKTGLYAITGENATGKSTLITCAATVFYNLSMEEHFGTPNEDAFIRFELNESQREWTYKNNKWNAYSSDSKMKINGFYEGSLIFGNRFRNTNRKVLKLLDTMNENDMQIADQFIRENLGLILHNDSDYYNALFYLKPETARTRGINGSSYFIKREGKLISQARMSTGENLLLSILNSIFILYKKRKSNSEGRPCIVFLDEIEFALHASALRRLVDFLHKMAEEADLAIYFSTHSIELIRTIKPQNIFYLSKNFSDDIIVTNPCYPAYATKNLYSDDGFGNDVVVLVEDDLAKLVFERVLIEKSLKNNMHVKVLPTGGWTNTIEMAFDITTSGILMKGTRLLIVLDRDIKDDVPIYLSSHKQYRGLAIDYLPITSLEKYLKHLLIDDYNHEFFSLLDNYVFVGKPLTNTLHEYKKAIKGKKDDDKNGKTLYGFLIGALHSVKKDREDLVDIVMRYLEKHDDGLIEKLADYFAQKTKY